MKPEIFNEVEDLSYAELTELLAVVQGWLWKKNPTYIAQQSQYAAITEKRRQEALDREAHMVLVVGALQGNLEPGMILKMKGCKDGSGIREFIRWQDNNLVCWQIKRGGVRTNQVTVHMADKVTQVWLKGLNLRPTRISELV